eukprot:981685_1
MNKYILWIYALVHSCKGQLEGLGGKTTEENGIAWAKAFSCDQDAQSVVYDDPFNDLNGFIDLAQYATSIKFVSASYSTYATECSNPVYNLNNGKELSYTTNENTGTLTGYANQNNWNDNTNLMWNSCYGGHPSGDQYPFDISKSIYWACNNGAGLLVLPTTISGYGTIQCHWNGEKKMDIYLGFDTSLQTDCYGNTLTGPSSRDCSVLAIDEFLLQCSSEFPAQTMAVTDLDTRITTMETDLQTDINTNTGDISQLKTDLTNGNTGTTSQISTLQQSIDDVNARIDLYAAKSVIGMIDSSHSNDLNNFNVSVKDVFIILFMVVNLVVMVYIYCYRNGNGKALKQVSYTDVDLK